MSVKLSTSCTPYLCFLHLTFVSIREACSWVRFSNFEFFHKLRYGFKELKYVSERNDDTDSILVVSGRWSDMELSEWHLVHHIRYIKLLIGFQSGTELWCTDLESLKIKKRYFNSVNWCLEGVLYWLGNVHIFQIQAWEFCTKSHEEVVPCKNLQEQVKRLTVVQLLCSIFFDLRCLEFSRSIRGFGGRWVQISMFLVSYTYDFV